MALIDPEDFADRPYVGGMNQALHFVFGAALLGFFHFMFGMSLPISVLAAGGGIIFWEAYQLKHRKATTADYIADLVYWLSGIAFWSAAIGTGAASGLIEVAPVVPLFVWLVEYSRLGVTRNVQ